MTESWTEPRDAEIARLRYALDERTRERDEAQEETGAVQDAVYTACYRAAEALQPGSGIHIDGSGTDAGAVELTEAEVGQAITMHVEALDAGRAEAEQLRAHVERLRGAWPNVRIAAIDSAMLRDDDGDGASSASIHEAVYAIDAALAASPASSLAAHDRAVRAATLESAVASLNNTGDDDSKSDEWLAGFQAAIDALRALAAEAGKGDGA